MLNSSGFQLSWGLLGGSWVITSRVINGVSIYIYIYIYNPYKGTFYNPTYDYP